MSDFYARKHERTNLLALLLYLLLTTVAGAQDYVPPPLREVDFGQNLGGLVPLDATFADERGETVTLRELGNEQPILLVLAYYECPMLCTLVLNGVVDSLKQVPFNPAAQMQVVIISIDPAETPELAAAKKGNYLQRYGRTGTDAGWHFLTGTEEQIRRVADAIGYRYVYDTRTKQYAHPAGVTLLTADGRIARYLYGTAFRARDLRWGLIDASEGRIGSPVDRVLLTCYHYDPTTGKYGFAIITALRIGGVLTLAALGGGIWWMSRRHPRNPRRPLVEAAP